MGRLSSCLAFILSSDNYNVNDWVLKETLLGCILNSACAAWCTGESAQTLSQFLISSVRKNIGPCYTALSESLIIIFVRAAYSQPHQFPQTVNFTALAANPCGTICIVADGSGNLFFFFFFCLSYTSFLCLLAMMLPDALSAYFSHPFQRPDNY